MATQIAPLTDAAYTPEQAVLTDTIANEVYAAHYNERKTSRIIIGGLSVLLLGSFASIVALAHKPVINRYIRIDEMGKAQAIQYSDLNYSPTRGRGADLPHGLGELSLHAEPGDRREEVPAELLLPLAARLQSSSWARTTPITPSRR